MGAKQEIRRHDASWHIASPVRWLLVEGQGFGSEFNDQDRSSDRLSFFFSQFCTLRSSDKDGSVARLVKILGQILGSMR